MNHRNQIDVYYSKAQGKWIAESYYAETGSVLSASAASASAALTALANSHTTAGWAWDASWEPPSNERAKGT